MANLTKKDLATTFRQHLSDLDQPRFQIAKTQSAYEYTAAFQKNQVPPWLYNLTQTWQDLLKEPYKGVTNDGNVREGLFQEEDGGVDIENICSAAKEALSNLTSEQKEKIQYPLNATEWRCWSNPEFLLRPLGLRLEEIPEEAAHSILSVLEATFSREGYQKALDAMHINHFLGELCDVPRIMNKFSYNFLLFGKPSTRNSWGFSFYGHHLCLNVFLKGKHVTISPSFTGAEPNVIDDGPWRGTAILHREGDLGLSLMQSLPEPSQKEAQIYTLMRDEAMLQSGDLKVDRWNRDDQRHVCGAFRDNRVVPYEGIKVSEMEVEQQERILDIADEFLLYLPAKARAIRKEHIRTHFPETYFSWIGGFGDEDPFYYRIQSPVIVLEFDHHSGVFLNNSEPAKFHTHTICRMPNAGDYGQALRDEQDRVL